MTGRHFSMIRNFHLADFFTIVNGFCGVAALFQAMWFLARGERGRLDAAAALIVLALLFDVLDGRIARWRHHASPMRSTLDQIILMYFVGCGLSRLARYNVTAESLAAETGKVRYFEGTPIPTSIIPLGVLLFAFHRQSLFPAMVGGFELHLVSLLFLLSGSLMISKTLKVPKP
jgi:CDP-diacylglycerol--serine O-phosphatidyltransferase